MILQRGSQYVLVTVTQWVCWFSLYKRREYRGSLHIGAGVIWKTSMP